MSSCGANVYLDEGFQIPVDDILGRFGISKVSFQVRRQMGLLSGS